jgi:glucuronoarabinoxylan endo-1,4-beta-xylanase
MTARICQRRAARGGLPGPSRIAPALLGTVVAAAAAASLAGCGPGGSTTGSVTVDLDDVRQTIDGFGAADAFLRAPLTADQNALFWDPTNGIGLSLLRVGINPNGQPMGGGTFADAEAANAFGVRVWAAPWSPPASDKSNNSIVNGGSLNSDAYASWAAVLAGFATSFQQTTGFPLYAMSAQNEPDFVATWPSCIFSAAEMVAFVKVLGPMLHALDPPVKLLAPEPDVWDHLWTGGDRYGPSILADADASAAIDVLATHDYGHINDSDPGRPAVPAGTAQPLWETEVSDQTAADPDIAHGVRVATWIHAAIANGGASAWHYWWLVSGSNDGQGLLVSGDTTNPPKRLYTVGNFSKFIRPGFRYVGTSGSPPSNALISSYVSPAGQPVIVAINGGGSVDTVSFQLRGGGAATVAVTPYVTSADANLAAQPDIPVTDGAFSASLDGQTVTTFVGR